MSNLNLRFFDAFSGEVLPCNPHDHHSMDRRGQNKSLQTPGGHRRIMRGDLDEFCRATGIPIE